MDQRGEVVLVRSAQSRVVPVQPGQRQLERAARVEAGGARVGIGVRFGLPRRIVHGGELGLQEGEVAHRAFKRASAWASVSITSVNEGGVCRNIGSIFA